MLQNTTKQISYYYANPEQNRSIINAINSHDYERLINLLTPRLSDIIVINAIYATIHLIIYDNQIDHQSLFNAHNQGKINIHKLTGLTYEPEPGKSASILNLIREYSTKYKLLSIDIRILYLLINKYNILNIFMFTNYIVPHLPDEYKKILTKIFLNKNYNKLAEIYKQLQDMFADKLYNAVKSTLNAGTELDQTLSILYQQLTFDFCTKYDDIQNILKKTLELLTINNIHGLKKQQEYLLLYSHHKLQQIVQEWTDEPIENSRLYKKYKNYYKA